MKGEGGDGVPLHPGHGRRREAELLLEVPVVVAHIPQLDCTGGRKGT